MQSTTADTQDNMRFSDPTAVGVVGALSDANRDEFIEYFRKNMVDVGSQVNIVKSFEKNCEVVLYLNYRGTMASASGETVSYQTEGITILTIVSGKVEHHRDYFDYDTLFASYTD